MSTTDSINIRLKTLGGKQFWTDLHHQGGWRIQENAVTGHFRLIDAHDVRHAWGDRETCRRRLQNHLDAGHVKPTAGPVVVLLHGLIRTTESMRHLGRYLQEYSQLTAIDFEYASTRRPVAYHAQALKQVIDSLGPKVTEINFVGHSLGNIVVRRYLADELQRVASVDSRFRRMVMIGPPNQGSRMARVLRYSILFRVIAGSCGQELGAGWDQLEPTLAVPPFEFGVIAGGQTGRSRLSNFILSGPDDFTLSVDETRLAGATDFMVEPLLHATMMRQPVTMRSTLNFLQHGWFRSADLRQPIAAAP